MTDANSVASIEQPLVAANDAAPGKMRLSRTIAMDLLGLADAAAVMSGFLLPAFIYTQAGGIASDWSLLFKGSLAAALVMHVGLRLTGMYATDRMHDLPHRPATMLAVVFLGVSLVMGSAHHTPSATSISGSGSSSASRRSTRS